MNIATYFVNSMNKHVEQPPFKLVGDEKYHGGKKSEFRNGFAASISKVTITFGGKQ